jgi:hypothetical protein
MIYIYPMLSSDNISPNVIPGICKVLEKFVLLYRLDDILHDANRHVGWRNLGSLIQAGQSIVFSKMRESEELYEADKGMATPPPRLGHKPYKKSQSEKDEDDLRQIAVGGAQEYIKSQIRYQPTDVFMPSDNSLSVEPTWVKIDGGRTGLHLLGVKVISFPFKTTGALPPTLVFSNDQVIHGLEQKIFKYSRKATRAFFSICRGLRIPFIKSRALTGDIERDVLWASTEHGRNLFTLFSSMDVQDNEMFKSAGGVKKMFSLGWTSFIVADDVNKRVTFCMDEFKGLCSVVLYPYMFAGLGHSRVYDSLEDVRKSASPFFKISSSPTKLFGESIASIKAGEYLDALYQSQFDEDR